MNIKALTIAAVSVIWLIVAMTLGTEVSESFKTLIAKVGGHHWIGKSIISFVSFVLVYLLFKRTGEPKNVLTNTLLVVGSVVLGGLIIFLFFLWHFLNG